jgi:hypothetical protein
MDTMPPCAPGDAAIAGLVAQMLQTTGTLTLVVDEMMRFQAAGHSAPDAPSVIDILDRLLRDVLASLLATHPAAAIEEAAAVLREADEIVCRDLYFVSPDAMPAPRQRRPGTPRARRRRT